MADDVALVRIYKYLHWTRRVGLWLRCDLGELQEIFFKLLADADHAGDRPTTTRSTSGYWLALHGEHTCMPLEWSAKLQGSTATSTPAAEVTATCDGTLRAAIPAQTLFHQVIGKCLPCHAWNDNEAANAAVHSGHSRRMSHLRKQAGVSLGALRDYFVDTENSLSHETTEKMSADLLTKPLDHVKHWRFAEELGLGMPPPALASEGPELKWSSWR